MWSTKYIAAVGAVAIICILLACKTQKLQYIRLTQVEQLETLATESPIESKGKKGCSDPLNYIPDMEFPDLHKPLDLRVNIHFMYNGEGKGNFGKAEGKKFMIELLNNANERISENKKMKLPKGNDTPALPINYQYVITPSTDDPSDDGFYYHNDDELYYFINKGKNRNNYDRKVINKYKIGSDSIINIFVLPHHPDSVKSKTYKGHGSGIALGSDLKVSGLYSNERKSWKYATLVNHEIGHILGLRHSWINNDGCDDTPKHPNCWDDNDSRCDGLASNNMMDYNNSQGAITPCQIGIMYKNISKSSSMQRKLFVPNWCELDPSIALVIDTKKTWGGAKDISNDIIVAKGGELTISCRLSMAQGGSITVEPGGKLILNNALLHNDCGHNWKGIKIGKSGSNKGLVEYIGKVLIEDVEQSK